MKILAIESSCDETSAAIILGKKNDISAKVVSNITASSLALHSKTGGIIPEIAAREQIKYILPAISKTLKEAGFSFSKEKNPEIDAIAVTIGPGLIGSLLVGVETAKTLSMVWNKPIIPVNHLFGHIYANWISNKGKEILFPAVCLVASGGHTDLILIEGHQKIRWLGGTRDDAAGEAFDKIGRLLSLSYPGGPAIEKEARNGNDKAINFPKPLIGSNDFDFSFSGLKTAVLREVKNKELTKKDVANISASVQKAIIEVLVKKTLLAAEKHKVKSILLSGGVAANEKLRSEFRLKIKKLTPKTQFFFPEKWLCTDNAAMIGAAAIYNGEKTDWKEVNVDPELFFN